jgi:membrane-associated phospholipid phosphatase
MRRQTRRAAQSRSVSVCAGMTRRKVIRTAGKKLTEAEALFGRAVTPPDGTIYEKVITRIGKMGDQPELRTISALVIAGGLIGANRRLVRAGVRMMLAHEIATLAKDLIKRRIDRTRPHTATSHSERKVRFGRRTAKKHTSFPSGHSAGAIAVARAFACDYPEYQAAALATAAVVAGAQVPRLTHYPTDVAGGIVLGAASAAAANWIVGPEAAAS